MKKTLTAILLIACMMTLLIPAVHAENLNAFENIELNGSTEKYIDDPETDNQGGNGKTIGFVPGYGCGNSSLNDIVAFEDVDFGTTGAKSITLFFAYYGQDDQTTDLAFYYDDYSDEAFITGTAKIASTGGWSTNDAVELTFPVDIPAGTHNIYIKFTTGNSGSFSYIRFGTEEVEGDKPENHEYTGDPLADSSVINIFDDALISCFELKNDMYVSFSEGNLKFTAATNTADPYVRFNIKKYYEKVKSVPITADDYSCIVIKLKADETISGTNFELFAICNEVTEAGVDSANVTTSYVATGDWEYILFDFSVCPSWYGEIKSIRLDWNTGSAEGESMEIAEFRFLKDEEAAEKFIDEMTGETEEDTTAKSDSTQPEVTTAAETTAVFAVETTIAETVASDQTTATAANSKSGCNGYVAGIAILAIFGAAAISIKKKNI